MFKFMGFSKVDIDENFLNIVAESEDYLKLKKSGRDLEKAIKAEVSGNKVTPKKRDEAFEYIKKHFIVEEEVV